MCFYFGNTFLQGCYPMIYINSVSLCVRLSDDNSAAILWQPLHFLWQNRLLALWVVVAERHTPTFYINSRSLCVYLSRSWNPYPKIASTSDCFTCSSRGSTCNEPGLIRHLRSTIRMRSVSDGFDYSLLDSGILRDLRIDSTMWIRSVFDSYDYFWNIATSEWTMWIRSFFDGSDHFFIDSGISQLQIDDVNKVCYRRLWLFFLIPGPCELRIDDVNKFCFRRLWFRPRFWEPEKP